MKKPSEIFDVEYYDRKNRKISYTQWRTFFLDNDYRKVLEVIVKGYTFNINWVGTVLIEIRDGVESVNYCRYEVKVSLKEKPIETSFYKTKKDARIGLLDKLSKLLTKFV